jgi:threonylcarbamoyladenosine tRNA methylthiotransferase MtaB
MTGFHIENFGCRAARADGEAVGAHLRAAGQCEGQPSEADVVIVNTCSVTAEADRAARAFIRRSHRRNPDACIVVTGCYAQRAPEELAALPGVSAVVGNSHKALAPHIALSLASGHDFSRAEFDSGNVCALAPASPGSFIPVNSLIAPQGAAVPMQRASMKWVDDTFAHSFIEVPDLAPGSLTRPNLKIQEGCANRCTFCVIPQTRGGSRSLSAESILRQARNFVASGGNELVLSGINLGRWGRDLTPASGVPSTFSALVRAILTQTELPRLRLSSIEPMDWDADLVALVAEFAGGRLAPHAHLPLQSGSDAVLRRMHRRYRPWHYEQKVHALFAAAGPDLTLGADVMIGFPGESDAEFAETFDFIQRLPFGYLHLFPFSPRPGTRAWDLYAAKPAPKLVVEDRMAALRALTAEKTRAHRMRFLGRTLPAITLHTPSALGRTGAHTSALTANFLPVEVEAKLSPNLLIDVQIARVGPDGAVHAELAAKVKLQQDGSQYTATAMSV